MSTRAHAIAQPDSPARTRVGCVACNVGARWALHVIETPTAWAISLAYILGTVVSGWPVVFAIVHGICLLADASNVVDTTLSK